LVLVAFCGVQVFRRDGVEFGGGGFAEGDEFEVVAAEVGEVAESGVDSVDGQALA
jgi:hypothetical protein